MVMDRPTSIAVIETTAIVTDSTSTMRSLQLLNIIVHTDTYVLSLVRYIPDLVEFDQLIKCHYHKVKIQFPTLTEHKNQKTSRTKRRSSIKQLFTSLSSQHHGHSRRKKTNSEKVEKYLNQCLQNPIVRQSTILRDFLSIQRDEDQKLPTKPLHLTNIHSSSASSSTAPSTSSTPSKSSDLIVVQKQIQQDPKQHCTTSTTLDNNNNNNNNHIDTPIINSSKKSIQSSSLDKIINNDNDNNDNKQERSNEINSEEQAIITIPNNDHATNNDNKNHQGIIADTSSTSLSSSSSSSSISNSKARRLSVKDDMVTLDDLLGRNDSIPSLPANVVEPVQEVTMEKYNTSAIFPLDYFEMITVLGKGCMGKVFLVRSNINHELYALKSIVKELVIEQREITHSLTEREILATLADIRHPNLAKLYLAFQDTYRLYLVTDYYCGGDLATQMSTCMTFSKERTRFYAAEMIEGIGELHRLGILYRDLKPENILLTKQGHVVLTDFGLSKWLVKTDYTETFCGTAEYLAPEVLTGDPYSFGIDHWSYGTILFEMLAGITPFWADNHMEMYRRVLEDPLEFPLPDENGLPEFDYETVDFLTAILDRNPATRLGAGGVQEIKSHAYFAGISWDDVYHQKLQPPYVPILSSQTDFSNFDATFLDMPTILTPMGSQVNLTHDMQDVFEGYTYNNDRFLPKMKSFVKLDSIQQVDDEEEEVEREQQQLQREEKEPEDHMVDQQQHIVEINMMTDDMIIDEVDTTDNHHYNGNNSEQISTPSPHQTSYDTDIIVIQNDGEKQKISPTFQPARKRGSISLLSEVGSFQLDSPLIHNDHDRTVKRRNTHDDILLTSPPPSKPLLLVDASSSTTTTMDDHMDDSLHTSSYVPDTQFLSKDPYDPHLLFDQHHHHLQQQPQHQQELQTESDIQLDFEGPDLDLRFSLEVDQNQHGFSSNPTKIPTKPKKRKYSTRRLLSPFIRF